MSIIRWYEIACDYCGSARHYRGNKRAAEANYKADGNIVTKGHHFCGHLCNIEFEQSKESPDE
jgi:hypothetical protein